MIICFSDIGLSVTRNPQPVTIKFMNPNENNQSILKAILLILILLATVITYSNIFGHDFQSIWGDDLYLLNDRIQDFSLKNITGYFWSFHGSNYHPLTSLSFAVNFQIFGLNPTVFHVQNLILHLLNIVLVFILINKITKNLEIAVIIALFFGIHPMHVESVTWISGRKDLIYSVFFLISLIFYYKYIQDKIKRKYYYLSLLMFFLSLLANSLAITLPLVLLLMDYYADRKFTNKILKAKIPFFALSIIFGIIAIIALRSSETVSIAKEFTMGDRFFLISFGLLSYIVMLFAPFKQFAQSAIHYYPDKIDGFFPIEYYFAPAIILVLIILILIIKRYRKDLVFGFLFFFLTISVVSQVIPVGNSIISERYTYIPYIGLFFIIAFIYNQLANKWRYRRIMKPLMILILLSMGVMFSMKSWNRNKVWKDSIKLFGNVARRYPKEADGLYRKGLARYKIHDVRGAVLDFKDARIRDPFFTEAYFARGIGRSDLTLYDAAAADFGITIQLDSAHSKAWQHRGATYIILDRYEEAIFDLDIAISLDPEYSDAYKNRGIAKFKLNMNKEALKDINKAIELKADNGEAYYYRGLINKQMQNIPQACSDWYKADSLGYELASSVIEEYCVK